MSAHRISPCLSRMILILCAAAFLGGAFGSPLTGEEPRDRAAILAELPEAILYVSRHQYRPDHHNTATLFQTGEINTGSFRGGAALKVWFPKSDTVQTILTLPEGVVRDPTVSFDAKRVLFSFRKSIQDDYHIGELILGEIAPDSKPEPIVIGPDTSTEGIDGFRQITFLKGISDIDPIYLPDGRILFSSTREPKYCMCNRHIMCNLFVMNDDGTNIEQIGKSTLFEGHGSLLPDGRILYDRWEYVDRNFGDAQGLWTTNPDGTKHELFWGNNTASPGGVIDARILPDSDSEFIAILGSCHDRPWGAAALIDRRLGTDGKEPVLMTWPPEARNWIVDAPGENPLMERFLYDTFWQARPRFEDPYPLSDSLFLASGSTDREEEMAIWALSDDGGMVTLHEDPESCFDPMPIVPTKAPMVISERVDRTQTTGVFAVSNLYEGMGMENVQPGSIKYLRVIESPEKRYWTPPEWQNRGGQSPGMNWDDFANKRILGTVPVEPDGSVQVEVPAEKFLYFQVLDENKMMIQSMRSGVMVRPGETSACVGCHESRIDAPSSANISPSALAGEPQKLRPWLPPLRPEDAPEGGPDAPRLFSYRAEIQPIFDRYCLACHDYGGPGAGKVILAGDRTMIFCKSYEQLRSKGYVRVPGAGPHNLLPAGFWGSSLSRLTKLLHSGHPDPMVDKKRKEMGLWFDAQSDPESFERIITWIDLNAPYYPTYTTPNPDNRFGRSPLSDQEAARLEALVDQGNLAFEVSFDRPEISPCLQKWRDAEGGLESPEYQEALSILRLGADRLAAQNPGDDPNFVPVTDKDIRQEKKYQWFRARESAVREAILRGERLSDKDFMKEELPW